MLTIAGLAAIPALAQDAIPALKHPRDKFWGSAWGWSFLISVIVFLVVAVHSVIEQRARRQHE